MVIHIVVGSTNPIKINSTKRAFDSVFHDQQVSITSKDVPSKVSAMPLSDHEMRQGAKNRALTCIDSSSHYGVGIEGGVHLEDELGFLRAWAAIYSVKDQIINYAATVSIPTPIWVIDQLKTGLELKDVIDSLVKRNGVNKQEGAFGVFTKNRITREDTFYYAIIACLARFYNPTIYATPNS